MLTRILLLAFHLVFGLSSCKISPVETKIKTPRDTVTKDIPLTNQTFDDYNYVNELANKLKLDNIDDAGFDSVQIRVWLLYSMAINKHLFIFKNIKTKWEGKIYHL
jgi:hypothetical protein